MSFHRPHYSTTSEANDLSVLWAFWREHYEHMPIAVREALTRVLEKQGGKFGQEFKLKVARYRK